ncbi:MAG: prepilin-type N-terminal cleavage/methylation domain-containing protein [Candidatus Zixiibacteriota bacterium]
MLRKSKGFTLIELMIVVVIIGILAAIAIPRFMSTSAKAKQAEAKGLLKQVYTMERAYYQEHGTYTNDIAALGVQVMASAWYDYSIVVNGTNFIATANAAAPGIDDDPTPDIWTVDGTGVIVNTSNDVLN